MRISEDPFKESFSPQVFFLSHFAEKGWIESNKHLLLSLLLWRKRKRERVCACVWAWVCVCKDTLSLQKSVFLLFPISRNWEPFMQKSFSGSFILSKKNYLHRNMLLLRDKKWQPSEHYYSTLQHISLSSADPKFIPYFSFFLNYNENGSPKAIHYFLRWRCR